jgi:mRNA interferase RelE/StbE
MEKQRYRVFVKPSVLKEMRRIPTTVARHLHARFVSLADDPFPPGSQKMQGHKQYYRIRLGSYRIVYEVATEIRIITVIRVAHRKEVYRKI